CAIALSKCHELDIVIAPTDLVHLFVYLGRAPHLPAVTKHTRQLYEHPTGELRILSEILLVDHADTQIRPLEITQSRPIGPAIGLHHRSQKLTERISSTHLITRLVPLPTRLDHLRRRNDY